MSSVNQILYTLSSISNYFPIIPLIYLYNKINKGFKIYLLVLVLGSTNDLLGYAKSILGFHFDYMFIIDIYEILNFGLLLYFFCIINNNKHIEKYLITFLIGLIVQYIDWFYITKFKYNTIYATVFYYSVFSFLSFDRINYQIINTKKTNHKIDWLLLFFITICIYYSYALFTFSLYCLNIPLNIKIEPSLYYILNMVNIFTNISLAIILIKYFKTQKHNFLI